MDSARSGSRRSAPLRRSGVRRSRRQRRFQLGSLLGTDIGQAGPHDIGAPIKHMLAEGEVLNEIVNIH